MASSSSSSAVSLDPTDTALCTPLLLETKEDAQAHAITAFFKLPTRILIGTKKLDFPVSPAHMLYNCALWQKAVEGGDEPKALLTETCVEPTDIEFQRAWMKVNGFDDDGKGPLGEAGERYLDYLGYKTPRDGKRALRSAMAQLEKYKDVCDGTVNATKIIQAYTKWVEMHGNRVFEYEEYCSQAVDILKSQGFVVSYTGYKIQLRWVPPERNAATKRPRPE